MSKHLKLFKKKLEYDSFKQSEQYVEPNIAVIQSNKKLHYNYQPRPIVDNRIKNYFRFVAVEDSSILVSCMNIDTGEPDNTLDLQYSKDGKSWTQYNFTAIPLTAGETLYMKGNNPNGFSIMDMETGGGRVATFADMSGEGNGTTGTYECHGNIMSLMYGDDFENKNIIPSAGCFYVLFMGCDGLLTAPVLPATTLAAQCYIGMFLGCTSLVTAPELPAFSLAEMCYYIMFQGCTSLVTAPELPATTLTEGCYCYMFEGCTSLVTAPEILPATTLADSCYYEMFRGCSSLTTAPELPATTLAYNCYCDMFNGCTSLVIAPELLAATLSENCYYGMFGGCSKLNNITMLATNINANNCLSDWVDGVASTGTFTKHNNMTSLSTGINGIPEGWEVKNHITPTECTSLTITAEDVIGNDTTTTIHYIAICNGVDYKGNTVTGFVQEGTAVSAEFPQNTSETETVERTITFELMDVTASTVITQGVWNRYAEYLTFEAIEDSTFKLTRNACSYSLDNGTTWTSLVAATNTPTVSAGNKIMFKATNPTMTSSSGMGTFSATGKFNVEGNMMSLLYGDDFKDKTDLTGNNYAFYGLFSGCTNVVEASNLILPATTLVINCYDNMFKGCTSLTTAPELPATTLASYCYRSMFNGCSSLATAPELPATILAENCYTYMFKGCTSLTTAPELPATTLADYCYDNMFRDCANLTTAPTILPATTLTDYCYRSMFYGCTSLTTAPELPATTLASYCYYYMFYGCSNLTTAPTILPAATLTNYCYSYMFYGCGSLKNITMLATDISATKCLYYWVNAMASGGTFTKHKNMSSLPTGASGIPHGWTVKDYFKPTECTNLIITADDIIGNETTTTIYYTATVKGLIDYQTTITGVTLTGTSTSAEFGQNMSDTETVEKTITFEYLGATATTTITQGVWVHFDEQYLTFEAIEDSTFKLTQNACEYSLDNGATWVSLAAATNTPTVSAANKIMFKATNPTITSSYGIGTFSSTGKFNVSGNIMSMLYGDDFAGKTDLTGKDYAFYKLFYRCTKVIEAHYIILPAITLSYKCYQYVFSNCTNLTTVPELPATTLASYCYDGMFGGCTSLINAPALPATTLANYCYHQTFYHCTNLTTVPELPATTLAKGCYNEMFRDCTSLTTSPALPATTLAKDCYLWMFYGTNVLPDCSNIDFTSEAVVVSGGLQGLFAGTKVTDEDLNRILPKNNEGKYCLPVTILAESCYNDMFNGCTSLTTAPELPATTLAKDCYYCMFSQCTSLTTAPVLPATTLTNNCYYYMFGGCSKLNEITMLATDISASSCLEEWVYNVASTGTFTKHKDMISLPTGVDGIPEGWTVQDYEN